LIERDSASVIRREANAYDKAVRHSDKALAIGVSSPPAILPYQFGSREMLFA
jgi:hypothetical protein